MLLPLKGYERRWIYSDYELKTRNKDNLEVPWKASILDTPIFRPAKPRKSYISKTISLKYTDFNFHLKRWGMFAGFPGGVRSYCLGWGVASAIDNPGVTVAQRMQVVTAPTLAPTLVMKQEEDWPYC